jgi:pimeloyl-ACP methyl ester carboxylesterase
MTKSFLSILLTIGTCLSSISYAQVENETYDCDFKGIRSIDVPLYPDRTDSKKFSFKYQIVGEIDPEKIVVINLPGGPGGSSINDFTIPQIRDAKARNDLPKDVPWIMIDPRTVGCNRGGEEVFPDDSLTSEYLAYDVLNVIKDLGLKKYVIYGHSYGSQAATFVAGLSYKVGINPPHALFLSGILGRGEVDGSFAIPFNMSLQWELIKASLTVDARKIIETPNPLGIEDLRWKRLINAGLYDGYYMVNGVLTHPLMELLKGLDKPDSEERKKLTETLLRDPTVSTLGISDFSERLFKKIDCHEFSPKDGNFIFVEGRIVMNYDPCENEPFDRPYDAGDFEIKAPIYYLAGTADPAAPYAGARHHFESQVSAQRNFMTLNGGGHTRNGWIFQDCRDELWKAVFELKNLDSVLPNCKVQVELEIR